MAAIERGSWPVPPIFRLIQQNATVAENEMFRTFNMGIGMVLVIDADHVAITTDRLAEYSIPAHHIGAIESTDEAPHIVLRVEKY